MKLEQIKDLNDLYPALRLRSGKKVITTLAEMEIKDGQLHVLVKTVFPPSDRRRSALLVVSDAGTLRVSPLQPAALSDALRFTSLLGVRWAAQQPEVQLLPPCCSRDSEGRHSFVLEVKPPQSPASPQPPASPAKTADTAPEKSTGKTTAKVVVKAASKVTTTKKEAS